MLPLHSNIQQKLFGLTVVVTKGNDGSYQVQVPLVFSLNSTHSLYIFNLLTVFKKKKDWRKEIPPHTMPEIYEDYYKSYSC